MRVSKIVFCTGQTHGAQPLEIKPSTVVILVGPNNSGKSLALREIESCCYAQNSHFEQNIPRKVVKDVEIDFPTDPTEAKNFLRIFKTEPPKNSFEILGPEDFWVAGHTFNRGPPSQNVHHMLIKDSEIRAVVIGKNYQRMKQIFCTLCTVRLDGQTRFSLIAPTEAGDLASPPQNHLWALFRDEAKRNRVRELTNEAFGLYFLVDPTAMKNFRIRMSEKKPEPDEEGVDEKGIKFYNAANLIDDFGDGVKAFTGLVAAILSLPHTIILVDEPEAFLHPPLARRLGYHLAKISGERGASLIVATHSSEFLVGCMDASVDVSVVRLTYERTVASAKTLAANELKTIMHDALMRSTHVLRALFSRTAVVTEGDADRAFYEEINRRLQSEGRGIKDALFLNAQNVQTLHRIIGPLRKIGIPAAAIADIDFLCNNDGDWENILDACQIDRTQWDRIQTERKLASTISCDIAVSRDILKKSGIDTLGVAEKAKAELLLEELGTYGLFLVPVGELECWLKKIGAKDHGPQWLIDIFLKIGSSEDDANYIKPDADDVWLFIDKIGKWTNPKIVSP